MAQRRFYAVLLALLGLFLIACSRQAWADEEPAPRSGRKVLSRAMRAWEDIVEPADDAAGKTFVATVKIVQCDGLPKQAAGATAQIAYSAPDRLRIRAIVDGNVYCVGRDGNQIWVDEPQKRFAVLGKPGVARFRAEPDSIDDSVIPPFALPLSRMRLKLLSLMVNTEALEPRAIEDVQCDILRLTPNETAADLLHFEAGQVELWLRADNHLPERIIYTNGAIHVQADVVDAKVGAPWEADQWKLQAGDGETVRTVAVSHLLKCLKIMPKIALDKTAPLDPATGDHSVLATEGKGRLEMIDGTRVLFLKGTPEEMGRQHGTLLKESIHAVADRILYGFGVGSSFAKGSWFFGELEDAEARLEPFMDKRVLAEEDALADAAGMDRQESRLANVFPELFHCSGFALFGKANGDEHIYHGRVLDYLRGVGLEQNAMVIVHQPDEGHAWVNVGYAGFVGTVTAMNDQGISIGEMGGGGTGQWDGKPMAHLLREVMEKASTLDEAVKIMKDSPRTCQYYYVIADGKAKTAVGISASPTEFTTIGPGEFHPLLPHPVADTVLMSAGNRYDELAKRVNANYGKFDADSARKLMEPPVCMGSNIQSVLFEPDTLDFWVANADSQHVASLARYTHYNLKQLLAEHAGQ